MNNGTPSYDELIGESKMVRGLWKSQLVGMEPGEVRLMDVPDGRNPSTAYRSIWQASQSLPTVRITRRGDDIYAVCLRPEDE